MVDRVVESVDLYGRSDQYVVPDTDRCTVEHHAVEVDESPLTDIDVITVVAKKRRPDQAFGGGIGQ